jgi:hypothetical protein
VNILHHSLELTTMCSVVDNLGCASNDSNNISGLQATLPTDFQSWKKLYWPQKGFWWQWELLRTFFANKGYILYVYRESDPLVGLKPEIKNDPPDDSFGLLGVRTNFWPIPLFLCNVRIIIHIHFESYSINHLQRAEVWGARDMSVPCGLVRLIDLIVTS